MYLLTNECAVVGEWIEAIHNAQVLLKDTTPANQHHDTKTYLKPRLNVISSSPVPEDFANGIPAIAPVRSISPKARTLNNTPSSFNTSFIRNSPVVRKRINTVAKRNHLSMCEEKSPVDVVCINRSLSQQQSSKSHLSILEDDYDQPVIKTADSSLSSTEFRSSNVSIRSVSNDDLESTLSEKQINNLDIANDSPFLPLDAVMGIHDKRNSLKDSRAYKSMVDLHSDS